MINSIYLILHLYFEIINNRCCQQSDGHHGSIALIQFRLCPNPINPIKYSMLDHALIDNFKQQQEP